MDALIEALELSMEVVSVTEVEGNGNGQGSLSSNGEARFWLLKWNCSPLTRW